MVLRKNQTTIVNYLLKMLVLNGRLKFKLPITNYFQLKFRLQGTTQLLMRNQKQTAHRAVWVVHHKDLNNLHNCAVETAIVIPRRVLPCSKANATTLRSVVVNCVACELILHKRMQTQTKTNTTVNPVDHQTVPAPKWMQFAAAPVIVGQKSDKNNPLHDKILEGTCCVYVVW